MQFIGVSTGRSSVMELFPSWARVLDIEGAHLQGRDLPLGVGADAYRRAMEEIKEDPGISGALVTTHKLGVLAAAGDFFDDLDPYAELCREVSCISKRDGRLIGHAKDPITSGRSLEAMLGPGYFARTGAEVLCIGAGGAGTAISVFLMTRPHPADRPGRIIVVSRDEASLASLKEVHGRLEKPTTEVLYVLNGEPAANDEIMSRLPPASLVINATGMGKDLPGSPVTGRGLFPEGGVAWELNYRGELDFLRQARAQVAGRGLTVEDGWLYFLHGWSAAIAEVFSLELNAEKFQAMKEVTEVLRG